MSSVGGGQSELNRRFLELQIVNWPLRDDPLYAGSILVGCLAIGGFAGWWSASWYMGMLSTLAVMATVWKLWIPMTCHVGVTGLTVGVFRWQRQIAWGEIESLESRPHGIVVSAAYNCSHLAALGRVYLPWRGNEEAVSQICEHYASRFGTRKRIAHQSA